MFTIYYPQNDDQIKVVNETLESVGESPDLVLPKPKFTYTSSLFKSKIPIDLGQNSLEIVPNFEPKIPIDQIPLSMYANSFA